MAKAFDRDTTRENRTDADFYDVSYAMITIGITATGITSIATTRSFYHGISFVAGTTAATITIYDTVSAAAGNIIDIVKVNAGGQILIDKFHPIVARKGISANVVGTGGVGTVFYGPKS